MTQTKTPLRLIVSVNGVSWSLSSMLELSLMLTLDIMLEAEDVELMKDADVAVEVATDATDGCLGPRLAFGELPCGSRTYRTLFSYYLPYSVICFFSSIEPGRRMTSDTSVEHSTHNRIITVFWRMPISSVRIVRQRLARTSSLGWGLPWA